MRVYIWTYNTVDPITQIKLKSDKQTHVVNLHYIGQNTYESDELKLTIDLKSTIISEDQFSITGFVPGEKQENFNIENEKVYVGYTTWSNPIQVVGYLCI
jgi:hypothetical protein